MLPILFYSLLNGLEMSKCFFFLIEDNNIRTLQEKIRMDFVSMDKRSHEVFHEWMNVSSSHNDVQHEMGCWLWRWIQIQMGKKGRKSVREHERDCKNEMGCLKYVNLWVFCFSVRAESWQAVSSALPPTPLAESAVNAYRKISNSPQLASKTPNCSSASLVSWTSEI